MSDPQLPLPPGPLSSFDFQPRTRVVFGVNSVQRIGELARELKAEHLLLVTDPGIVRAGHAAVVQQLLEESGLKVALFSDVRENPTTACVDRCLATAKRHSIDAIIGLGGGSALDTAKGCNFLLTNGGRMEDYWGIGKATKPMLPLIAIPTTAGTGSECQSFAIIADETTHRKMACGDPKAAARIALLDPALTITQPFRVTACTGIDALAHAVESAVTKKRNPLSLMFAHEAFKLAIPSFPAVLANPASIESRGRMLLAAAFAGAAIENSMLGAAHSAANPLTARFNVVHGQAVGLMLPHVIRFNAQDPGAKLAYAELASAPEIACVSEGQDEAVEALISRIETLLDQAQFPRSLAQCGVTSDAIPAMARESAQQWTANFNPRPVTEVDFIALYEAAFKPRPVANQDGPAAH